MRALVGRARSCGLVGLLVMTATGCGTTPRALRWAPTAFPVHEAPVREPTCSSCQQQTREIERLRQDLATRDAELAELRSNQRDQVKVLQQSKREVTRAKVKLRRLATRADAASYIAEVEVAMESLRASIGARAIVPQMILAQRQLESIDEPFRRGDYGLAIEHAAQAEHLIASAADDHARRRSPASTRVKMPLRAATASKTTFDRRRGPLPGKALGVAASKADRPVLAHHYEGSPTQATP